MSRSLCRLGMYNHLHPFSPSHLSKAVQRLLLCLPFAAARTITVILRRCLFLGSLRSSTPGPGAPGVPPARAAPTAPASVPPDGSSAEPQHGGVWFRGRR